jgi:hypothetical protein
VENTAQKDELEAVEDQSVGTLSVAFAILISIIVLAVLFYDLILFKSFDQIP